ncbi:MAG: Asp-tRNA(Asn)/Glu-tRNA(Gln) amidotransferase subunit GatB [Candidatus Bipolaricaulota bacterium]|nr:Asp-tRNA(Asn)/Glu-tRNA(Gln) amidotransferase subunit GatB [Candidatus Bipolaricaulota bacterium]MCS7274585.1 Asp-tRNA(Asn)/Glu-tRNA(Gln) amidotransferase subunit GatB [Candidatus Bipolaricaulota bacterium]MDW8110984.1 Asp-tRNA(Asn)/Glu-tRNA(Gln) amidotransferase subunit GatB [Candidatus Bipolaricaulota bacterium]MDW8329015.1 Asp-tRNA(Asn)/Glu-tRNA(Gln) amidotransferase subunit GatB [Candidatus Bipolaricaulota bacterium]
MRTVIGLEVHAQLLTKTKLFCSCSAAYFGAPPNAHTCPVCLGMPGALPVLNERAVEYALKAALALHCEIPARSVFARKNYFYPDLPKGYQISQYEEPLALRGYLELPTGKRVRIRRLHLEEDAGKLLHRPEGYSLVDLNRAGVPLIEIVSEPDLSSPEEARLYMEELRRVLRYLGVCSGDMEEGSLRCDANVSVSPDERLGTKTEIKNMNSFRAIEEALKFEVARQRALVEKGHPIEQATLTWNEALGRTELMRSKEEAEDYRYFPEPDLVPLQIDDAWRERVKRSLPELPAQKRARWMQEYKLPEYDISVLTDERSVAEYFESVVGLYPHPKDVSNWMMSEILRLLKESQTMEIALKPEHFARVLEMVSSGQINRTVAKDVIAESFKTGKAPDEIVRARGLSQISDEQALAEIVAKVLAENPKAVADFQSGKEAAIGFLQGQVMKATGGKADPKKTREMLLQRLRAT